MRVATARHWVRRVEDTAVQYLVRMDRSLVHRRVGAAKRVGISDCTASTETIDRAASPFGENLTWALRPSSITWIEPRSVPHPRQLIAAIANDEEPLALDLTSVRRTTRHIQYCKHDCDVWMVPFVTINRATV